MNSPEAPYKRLYRSRKDKMIAGVCGGLGEYFRIDPVWVRLLFILFFLAFGTALVIYIVMWFIVPIAPENPSSQLNLS